MAIMKGKTLSYQGIMSAIKKYYPDIKISLDQLQKRVFALCMSNFVGIERHDDMPEAQKTSSFRLNSCRAGITFLELQAVQRMR